MKLLTLNKRTNDILEGKPIKETKAEVGAMTRVSMCEFEDARIDG
jgi:hypothetical protein